MNSAWAIQTLSAMGISAEILQDFPELPTDTTGVLLYGSQARGDAVPGSDLDVIVVTPNTRTATSSGDVNISYYTFEQLTTGIGTLFGAHLKRDGKVIWDSDGSLTLAVEGMGAVDTDRVLHRAWEMAELFSSPGRDLPKFVSGLSRQARYMLRSCLYAQAIAVGAPCFSVRELSIRHNDPDLTRLLASRQQHKATVADLNECLWRLRAIIGEFPTSRYGSLEACVVNEWGRSSDILSMAFMALGTSGRGSDYAEVERILL